jgi:NADH-quinone oxidoreductase subunit J
VGAEERGREEIFNRSRQVTTSVIFCGLLVAGLLYAINVGYGGLQKRDETQISAAAAQRQSQEQNLATSATGASRITKETERVGSSLYRYASLPFEIASILLLVAIIGSVMLARTLKQEAAVDDVSPDVLQKEAVHDPELAEVAAQQVP